MSRWIRIALAAALVAGLVAAAGCGKSSSTTDLKEGEAFDLGELNYNVLFTRFLNPAQVEDKAYLAGQPPPPVGKQYLATFLLVKNKGHDAVPLPARSSVYVTDTTLARYDPLASNSLFSFPYGSTLGAGNAVPTPDSAAADGPTQGSMLLFLVSEEVSSNRPLVLHVCTAPGATTCVPTAGKNATIELDI